MITLETLSSSILKEFPSFLIDRLRRRFENPKLKFKVVYFDRAIRCENLNCRLYSSHLLIIENRSEYDAFDFIIEIEFPYRIETVDGKSFINGKSVSKNSSLEFRIRYEEDIKCSSPKEREIALSRPIVAPKIKYKFTNRSGRDFEKKL